MLSKYEKTIIREYLLPRQKSSCTPYSISYVVDNSPFGNYSPLPSIVGRTRYISKTSVLILFRFAGFRQSSRASPTLDHNYSYYDECKTIIAGNVPSQEDNCEHDILRSKRSGGATKRGRRSMLVSTTQESENDRRRSPYFHPSMVPGDPVTIPTRQYG